MVAMTTPGLAPPLSPHLGVEHAAVPWGSPTYGGFRQLACGEGGLTPPHPTSSWSSLHGSSGWRMEMLVAMLVGHA